VPDARREPALYFRFDPPHRASTDPYTARKAALGFELVDHRAAEARHSADLRQAKNLCRQQGRSERIRKW